MPAKEDNQVAPKNVRPFSSTFVEVSHISNSNYRCRMRKLFTRYDGIVDATGSKPLKRIEHTKDCTQYDLQILNLNSEVEGEVGPKYHVDLDPDLQDNNDIEADISNSDGDEIPNEKTTFIAQNIRVTNRMRL